MLALFIWAPYIGMEQKTAYCIVSVFRRMFRLRGSIVARFSVLGLTISWCPWLRVIQPLTRTKASCDKKPLTLDLLPHRSCKPYAAFNPTCSSEPQTLRIALLGRTCHIPACRKVRGRLLTFGSLGRGLGLSGSSSLRLPHRKPKHGRFVSGERSNGRQLEKEANPIR